MRSSRRGSKDQKPSEATEEPKKDASASRTCNITDALIRRQSSVGPNVDLGVITSLDLHLRDTKLGKIRVIERLDKLKSLEKLNLSYNSISTIQGLHGLPLIELNLSGKINPTLFPTLILTLTLTLTPTLTVP